jgi:hypothetical protein
MRIETVPVDPDEVLTNERTQVVRLKVTGPMDPQNDIVRRARELVLRTGSDDMLKSFDRALERRHFLGAK